MACQVGNFQKLKTLRLVLQQRTRNRSLEKKSQKHGITYHIRNEEKILLYLKNKTQSAPAAMSLNKVKTSFYISLIYIGSY